MPAEGAKAMTLLITDPRKVLAEFPHSEGRFETFALHHELADYETALFSGLYTLERSLCLIYTSTGS